MSDYLVPAASVEWSEEIKKSRFVTLLGHAPDVAAARSWISDVRAAHPGARHHCWAYVAGAPDDSQVLGFSDDGEPAGTAGKPILAQLMGSGIGEICAVVVRYYGGILLGTGGLVKAYGGGVGSALRELQTERRQEMADTWLTCDYGDLALLEHLQAQFSGITLHADYAESVTLHLQWPQALLAQVDERLIERSQGRLSFHSLILEPR